MNAKATKTEDCPSEVKIETEDDFSQPQNLGDVKARLLIYECELSNMREWIAEQFGSPLNKKAILRLEQAENELKRLAKLAVS